MKKLMTVIAAVATAFGLYAADFAEHTINFSEITGGDYDLSENAGTTGKYWTYDGLTNGEYEATEDLSVAGGVLTIKTGSKALSRKFMDVEVGGGASLANTNLYVEMSLDFNNQALDDVPTAVDGAKVALFALEGNEENGAPAGTNLFVMAAYGENGTNKALYKLMAIDSTVLTGSRKIALKAYGAAAGSRAGFIAYIQNGEIPTELDPVVVEAVYAFDGDGKVVWTDVMGSDYLGGLETTAAVAKWVQNKSLFVSMDNNPETREKLASVDLVGNAKLASMTLTAENPGFPPDFQVMTIVDGSVAITNVTGAILVDKDNTIRGADGAAITIYPAIEKALARVVVNDADVAFAPAQESYNLTFVDKATIKVEEADVAATVTIGGKTDSYATIADAIKAANDAGAACELKLANDVTGLSEKQGFSNANGVVLDLNGKAFTGNANLNPLVENTGVLTIMDSVGGGYILNTKSGSATGVQNKGTLDIQGGEMYSVVKNNDEAANLRVTGGLFTNALTNTKGNLTTTGGAFKNDVFAQEAIPGVDYETYEVVPGEDKLAGYWIVQEKQAPTTYEVKVEDPTHAKVEVSTNDHVVAEAGGTFNFEEGCNVLVIYTADEHYHAVTGGLTNEFLNLNGPKDIKAPTFSIDTFTAKFLKEDETELSRETVEWNQKVKTVPEVPAKAGYTGVWSPVPTDTAIVQDTDFIPVYTKIDVESVTLDITDLTMNINDVSNLVATIAPEGALVQKVEWAITVGNDVVEITPVDNSCSVKALKDGKATITATADGKTATCQVTVNAAEEPLPDPINGGSEKQKEDYKKWAADNNVTGNDAINAVAFALNADVKAAGGNVETAIVTALDAAVELTADEVAKFSADYKGEPFTIASYPNAQFKFVQTDVIQSDTGRFFKLTAEFLSAND